MASDNNTGVAKLAAPLRLEMPVNAVKDGFPAMEQNQNAPIHITSAVIIQILLLHLAIYVTAIALVTRTLLEWKIDYLHPALINLFT